MEISKKYNQKKECDRTKKSKKEVEKLGKLSNMFELPDFLKIKLK